MLCLGNAPAKPNPMASEQSRPGVRQISRTATTLARGYAASCRESNDVVTEEPPSDRVGGAAIRRRSGGGGVGVGGGWGGWGC